jgi:hypothetical protein
MLGISSSSLCLKAWSSFFVTAMRPLFQRMLKDLAASLLWDQYHWIARVGLRSAHGSTGHLNQHLIRKLISLGTKFWPGWRVCNDTISWASSWGIDTHFHISTFGLSASAPASLSHPARAPWGEKLLFCCLLIFSPMGLADRLLIHARFF